MKIAAIVSFVAVAAACAGVSGASAQQAKQNFVLINSTGFAIKSVYVSPRRSNNWEEDVLGKDVLDDGTNVRIRFAPKTQTCHWDMKVVYKIDNSTAIWKDIDLCKVSQISLFYNKKNDTTSATLK